MEDRAQALCVIAVFAALFTTLASCVTTDVEPKEPLSEAQRAVKDLMTGPGRVEVTEGPASHWAELRKQYDRDQNGELLPQEMPNRDFKRFDRNGDGRVTLADFPTESGEIPAWLHDRLERQQAARLLRRAFGVWPPKTESSWFEGFRALDLNADLRLDRGELSSFASTSNQDRRDGFSALLDLVDTNRNDSVDWKELKEFHSPEL